MSDCFLPATAAELSPLSVTEELLRGMYGTTGLDLSGYRRSSLARRIGVRMQRVGMQNFQAYAAYCDTSPDEYSQLAQTILIQVTRFFRDPAVWEGVETQVLPRLLARTCGSVRVWCAGCASGEEAYTLAMILAETAGLDALAGRVRLTATDISLSAVAYARRGLYDDVKIADVPPRLRDSYFTRSAEGWLVCPALRDAVRFERHDLIHDAMPRRLDLISCRNTLMYFDPALQSQVLTSISHALRPDGCLLIGQAEGVPPGLTAFVPLDRRQRLFIRHPRGGRSAGRWGGPGMLSKPR